MSGSVLFLYGLFAILALVAVTPGIPWRWSLIAFFAIGHVSLPGLAGVGGDPVLDNAVKAVVIPVALLLRTRLQGLHLLTERPSFFLWIGFVVFTGIAVLWSPFPFAGFKSVGYLFAYTISIPVVYFSLRRSRDELVSAFHDAAWLGLVLASVQTYVMGGRFAGADPDRLSSFVAPQSFGIFLAFSFGLLLAFRKVQRSRRFSYDLLLVLLPAAVILNGSRFALVAIGGLFLWYLVAWLTLSAPPRRVAISVAFTTLVLSGVLAGLFLVPVTSWDALDRPGELPRALALFGVLTGSYELEDIGTLRFRLEMYDAILDYTAGREPIQRWLGEGTASVGKVVAVGYYNYRDMDFVTVDANRVAHNEFLRVYYDQGLIGLFCLILLSLCFGAVAVQRVWSERDIKSWMLFSLSALVVVSLASQNLFAASIHPSGLAVSLVIAAVLLVGNDRSGRRAPGAGFRSSPAALTDNDGTK